MRRRVEYWLETQGFHHFLLMLLLALFLVRPLTEARILGVRVGAVGNVAVLIASALAVGRRRWRTWAALAMGLPLLALTLLDAAGQLAADERLVVLGIAFFGFVAASLSVDLFRLERVNAGSISSALCIYLLFALTWGYIYTFIHMLDPTAFQGAALKHGIRMDASEFTYFSIVTLTTLGYGDITPVSRAAQTYATFEALAGQLYLVVVVSRLLGLHMTGWQKAPR